MADSGGEYERALQRLRMALTFGINPSLDGISQLTEALGRPQDSFRSIQITGTNGKTSTARVAAAALRANGFSAGLYTSPHLVSYTERVEIAGVPVAEEEFGRALNEVCDAADGLGRPFTEFELLTASAFVLFARRRVEWACLEVGMGGRWDATSIVDPAVAVITGIGLDHTERLGTTREEIARDKAHIIKPGSIAVLGPGCVGVEEIFLDRAAEVGAMVIRVAERDADVTYRVLGRPRQPGGTMTVQMQAVRLMAPFTLRAPSYQAPNVVCGISAVGAATWAVCDIPALQSELRSLTFPGRFELLRAKPPLVIDGAHNAQAAEVLATAIAEAFPGRKPLLVLAILEDKDALGIVRALAPVADGFVVTQNESPRCMAADALAKVVEHVTGETPLVEPVLERAISATVTGDRAVIATGSLYTAGGVRGLLKG